MKYKISVSFNTHEETTEMRSSPFFPGLTERPAGILTIIRNI